MEATALFHVPPELMDTSLNVLLPVVLLSFKVPVMLVVPLHVKLNVLMFKVAPLPMVKSLLTVVFAAGVLVPAPPLMVRL